jgi:hypothetical protein
MLNKLRVNRLSIRCNRQCSYSVRGIYALYRAFTLLRRALNSCFSDFSHLISFYNKDKREYKLMACVL